MLDISEIFELLEKKAATSDRGCLMAQLEPIDAARFVTWARTHIPEEHLDPEEGYENAPHVTVLWGFPADFDPQELLPLLDDLKSLRLEAGKVSRFENEGQPDVLKVSVESQDCRRLRDRLQEKYDLPQTFSDYNPHVTLAYVNSGALRELDGHGYFQGETYVVRKLIYSLPNSERKTEFQLDATNKSAAFYSGPIDWESWDTQSPTPAAQSQPMPAPVPQASAGEHFGFEPEVTRLLKYEGGDKLVHDTGGWTRYGISQRAYPHLDIKNLTEEQAREIYRRDYWPAQIEDPRIREMLFNGRVVSGRATADQWLQQALGVRTDGIIGPRTLEALNAADQEYIFNRLYDAKMSHYNNLATENPDKYGKYLNGWTNRTNQIRESVQQLWQKQQEAQAQKSGSSTLTPVTSEAESSNRALLTSGCRTGGDETGDTRIKKAEAPSPRYVKIQVPNKDGYLLHHYLDAKEWGHPAGRIEDNETPESAALRELQERTGFLGSSDHLTRLPDEEEFAVFSHPYSRLIRMYDPQTEINEDGQPGPDFPSVKAAAVERPKWTSEHMPRTGPEAIYHALEKLDLDKLEQQALADIKSGKKTRRPRAVYLLNAIRGMRRNEQTPQDLMITRVPVIPPSFRPFAVAGETFIPGDANELYKDLINFRNAYNRNYELLGDEGVADLRGQLYDSVKAVYGYGEPVNPKTKQRGVSGFLQKITGKTGPKVSYFQRKLLSKPQDSVARGTAIVDPELKMNQVGIPEESAWKMYAPYIQRRLVRRGMKPAEAIKALQNRTEVARRSLLEEAKVRPIIYSRAPAWHKYNTLAAWPVITDSNTISVNPMVTTGFNLDFDGDALNLHVPSSDDAVRDAVEKLMPDKMLFSIRDYDKIQNPPKHEQVLGLYTAYKRPARNRHVFGSENEALEAIRSGRVFMSDEITIAQPDNPIQADTDVQQQFAS